MKKKFYTPKFKVLKDIKKSDKDDSRRCPSARYEAFRESEAFRDSVLVIQNETPPPKSFQQSDIGDATERTRIVRPQHLKEELQFEGVVTCETIATPQKPNLQQDQKTIRYKQRQARAKSRLYSRHLEKQHNNLIKSQTGPLMRSDMIIKDEDSSQKLSSQVKKLQDLFETQLSGLRNDNELLRKEIFTLHKSYSQQIRDLESSKTKIQNQSEALEKLVRDNLGMSQSNQNITLNVNESTTNWSLFNIFDKKKNEETKKYQIKIDNTAEQIAL